MNIFLIAIIFLAGLVVLTKLSHLRSHLFYKTIGVIIIFFIASISYVWLKSGISPLSYEGFIGLSKTYFSWFASIFDNAKGITGYAAKQDWGINSTIAP